MIRKHEAYIGVCVGNITYTESILGQIIAAQNTGVNRRLKLIQTLDTITGTKTYTPIQSTPNDSVQRYFITSKVKDCCSELQIGLNISVINPKVFDPTTTIIPHQSNKNVSLVTTLTSNTLLLLQASNLAQLFPGSVSRCITCCSDTMKVYNLYRYKQYRRKKIAKNFTIVFRVANA